MGSFTKCVKRLCQHKVFPVSYAREGFLRLLSCPQVERAYVKNRREVLSVEEICNFKLNNRNSPVIAFVSVAAEAL